MLLVYSTRAAADWSSRTADEERSAPKRQNDHKPKWRICRSRCTVKMVLIIRCVDRELRLGPGPEPCACCATFPRYPDLPPLVLANITGKTIAAGMDAMSTWQGVIFPCADTTMLLYFYIHAGNQTPAIFLLYTFITKIPKSASSPRANSGLYRVMDLQKYKNLFIFLGHRHRRARQWGARGLWKWVSIYI